MEAEDRRKVLDMLAEGKIKVEDAERLLAAMGEGGPVPPVPPAAPVPPVPPSPPGAAPQALRVQVEGPDAHVNIRVPMQLIRAGMALGSLIPDEARGEIEKHLGARGVKLDLGKLKGPEAEEVIKGLRDLTVDVDDHHGGNKVRVFCE